MSELIEIQWSAASIEEARRVSRHLVQERFVACAQILPWVESIFMWDNQLETSQESKVFFKTTREHFEAVQEYIVKQASYEVPEITFKEIDGCIDVYEEWLLESSK